MTGGSLLAGAALAIVTVAYVARPFRAARREDLGRSIERWVAEVDLPQPVEGHDDRYCRQCGQALPPDSRFCPNCGTPVKGARS